ncbi:MAG: M20/M25/M40 family metallo-hydrolase [Planctomycetota bacterium]|nr:M20/M25/M40 family metallo-hydrolase [Planctomycetota bacterium]
MIRTPISSHHWRLPAIFFAAAALLSTLAGSSPQTASAEDLAPDAERILRHVTYLSSDELGGRDSGEPGLEIAAEYIARFYAKYGLEPAGDNGSYFQHFTIPQGACFVQDAGAVIEFKDGETVSLTPGSEVAAFGFTDGKPIEAPLAFVGYGISTNDREKSRGLDYDDFNGIDVKGKVVIILRYTPRYSSSENPFGGRRSRHAPFNAKIANAREHGAVGVIFVTPTGQPDQDCYGVVHRAAPRQPTMPALYARRASIDHLLRGSGETIGRLVKKIDEGLKPASFELKGAKIRFATARRHLLLRNVAGKLPGSDPKLAAETIVIGGHYDHIGRFGNQVAEKNLGQIHNGADDNASGTAGIIELARLLSSGKRPKRSFVFVAFSGEEIGLFGSRHWVNATRYFTTTEATTALESAPNPHGGNKGASLLWEAGTLLKATGSFQWGHFQVKTLGGESGWVKTTDLKQIEGPTPLHSVIAMINLDMIGRGKDDGPVTVLGAHSSAAFPPMLEKISKDVGLPIKLNKGLGGGGSDHANFVRRKVPVIFFFTGMHGQYNTPEDDISTVNIPFEARILDMAWKTSLELATAKGRPAFAQASAGSSGTNSDRPMLGIIIDPNHEGAGVKINEVVEDSVAEKGKLKVGDVIVAFGDTRVKALADLQKALEDRPQGKIKLKVIRGGSEKNAEVEFPARQGGFRVSFGSVPDYAYDEKGVRFEDIRPATPAAAAGVKPGDVLVRWAGKEVRDVQHWTELLGGHKPGDKVEIEVIRDKKAVKMTVLLKAR